MLLSQWLGRAVEVPVDDELYYSELMKRVETSSLRQAEETVLDTKGTF